MTADDGYGGRPLRCQVCGQDLSERLCEHGAPEVMLPAINMRAMAEMDSEAAARFNAGAAAFRERQYCLAFIEGAAGEAEAAAGEGLQPFVGLLVARRLRRVANILRGRPLAREADRACRD